MKLPENITEEKVRSARNQFILQLIANLVLYILAFTLKPNPGLVEPGETPEINFDRKDFVLVLAIMQTGYTLYVSYWYFQIRKHKQ